MYNEEIKTEYINNLDSDISKRSVKSDFKDLELLEDQFNEDVFCLPKAMIAQQLAQKCKSYSTLKNKMTRVNKYKEWANEKGYVPEDYRAFVYEKCNLQKIYSEYNTSTIFHTPSELKQMLDQYFSSRYENGITLDELASAYLMLLYQGFQEEEVLKITTANIIVKNKSVVISTPDKDVVVYNEFEDLVRKIYYDRNYMCLARSDFGIKEMGDRFVDNGKGLGYKQFKRILNQHICVRTADLNYKIADIYLMGVIFKKKMETGDSFRRDELLRECYGENFTEKNRIKLYDIIKKW